MQILLAKTAGCCMGVNRALSMVLDSVQKSDQLPIYTYGPLIHNPQVVQELSAQGVKVIEALSEIQGGTVVIRAHGVTPETRAAIEQAGATVIDATCPHVKKLQAIGEREARKKRLVVIIGDSGHAEVLALLGYVGENGLVISSPAEVDKVPSDAAVSVVAQTTQNRKLFDEIVDEIKQRCADVEVFTTICDATNIRQEECRQLSRQADVMLVIGGRNSANTVRLASVAEETGTRTYQIETEGELLPEWFEDVETVGVTAGASTPDWIIRRVIARLEEIASQR